MPKISIIIFILELYTELSVPYGGEATPFFISLPSVMEILDVINPINDHYSGYTTTTITSNFLISENTYNIFKNLLLISSLLSLIIGTVVGLAQSKIKRLLAYSTISHIGFILLALAINTEQSVDSLIFYIIQYSLTNLNTFLIILALGYIINNSLTIPFVQQAILSPLRNNMGRSVRQERDIKLIYELKGQFFANPLLSICLTLCLFSMAGKKESGMLAYHQIWWTKYYKICWKPLKTVTTFVQY